MLSVILLFHVGLAEWVGKLRIPEVNLFYNNLSRLDMTQNFGIKGYLCSSNTCKNPTISIHYNKTLQEIYTDMEKTNSKANLIFTDKKVSIICLSPTFSIPESNYKEIHKAMAEQDSLLVEILYYYDCNF